MHERNIPKLVTTMSIPFDSALSSITRNAERKPDAARAFELTESFCDRIAPQATRYAMSIVRVWADAEEVVQEAFCRLLNSDRCQPSSSNEQSNSSFQEDSNETNNEPKAILFSTIRNLSIDRLRKNGRRRFEAIDVNELARNEKSDELRLQRLENGIQASMESLPTQWSDAIQLKINGDLSYDEIANVLDATHAQVRTWIYRARKQLERDLNQKGLLECGSK